MKHGKSIGRPLAGVTFMAALSLGMARHAGAAAAPDYEREVKPLLREQCVSCLEPRNQWLTGVEHRHVVKKALA